MNTNKKNLFFSKKGFKILALIIMTLMLIFIILIPAILFISKFGKFNLSNNNVDWSNFGSFFGGTYSALFSMISTIILCATLYITQKNSKIQINILTHEQNKNEIAYLVNALEDKCNNKVHVKNSIRLTEKNVLKDMGDQLLFNIENAPDGIFSMTELIESAKTISRSNYGLYAEELAILIEIIYIIDKQNSDKMKYLYKALSINKLEPVRCFWLMIYGCNYSTYISDFCKKDLTAIYLPHEYA